MVSAVSASAATTVLSSSSSSASDIEAQIATKKEALAAAKTAAEKQAIQSEIDALTAKLQSQSSSSETVQAPSSPPSGESARIGTTNFDETTEFGNRTAYV